MTNLEKKECIKKFLGFSEAEFKMMTQADTHDQRLNKLFKMADEVAERQFENQYVETF